MFGSLHSVPEKQPSHCNQCIPIITLNLPRVFVNVRTKELTAHTAIHQYRMTDTLRLCVDRHLHLCLYNIQLFIRQPIGCAWSRLQLARQGDCFVQSNAGFRSRKLTENKSLLNIRNTNNCALTNVV